METITIERPAIQEVQTSSKIRELIVQLPIIAEYEDAKRVSLMHGAVYDIAHENNNAFDCDELDIDLPGRRLNVLNPDKYMPYYPDRARIGYARLVLAEFASYLYKGKIDQEKMDEVISIFGEEASKPDPTIDLILPYEKAITLSWWWQ